MSLSSLFLRAANCRPSSVRVAAAASASPLLLRSLHSLPHTRTHTNATRTLSPAASALRPLFSTSPSSPLGPFRTFLSFGSKKKTTGDVPPGGASFQEPVQKKGFIRRHKWSIAFFVISSGITFYVGMMLLGVGMFVYEIAVRLEGLQKWYETEICTRPDFKFGADELENDVAAFPPPSGRVYTLPELLTLSYAEEELVKSLKFGEYAMDVAFLKDMQGGFAKEIAHLETGKEDRGHEMAILLTNANSAAANVSELPHPETLCSFEEEIDSRNSAAENGTKKTDAENEAENNLWKKAFAKTNPWSLKSLLYPSVLVAGNYFLLAGLTVALEEAILNASSTNDQRWKERVELLQQFRQKRLLLHRTALTVIYKKMFDTWPKMDASSKEDSDDATLDQKIRFPLEVYLPFVDQLIEVNQDLNDLPAAEQWLRVLEGYNNSHDDLMARNALAYLYPSQQARVAMKQHDFRTAISKWKEVVQFLENREQLRKDRRRNEPNKARSDPMCEPGPSAKLQALIQLGHCYSSPAANAASVRDLKAAWQALDAAKEELNLVDKGLDYQNKRNKLLAEEHRLRKAHKAVPEELTKQIEAMPYYISKSEEQGLSDDAKERIEVKDLNSFRLGASKTIIRANIENLTQRLLKLDPQQKQR